MNSKKNPTDKNDFLEFISFSESVNSTFKIENPPEPLRLYVSSGLKREALFFNTKWILVSVFSLFVSLFFCIERYFFRD